MVKMAALPINGEGKKGNNNIHGKNIIRSKKLTPWNNGAVRSCNPSPAWKERPEQDSLPPSSLTNAPFLMRFRRSF